MDPLSTQPVLTPEELRNLALSPKDASGDGQRVSMHGLQDLIALDKHIISRQQGRPLFQKIVPPGAR